MIKIILFQKYVVHLLNGFKLWLYKLQTVKKSDLCNMKREKFSYVHILPKK